MTLKDLLKKKEKIHDNVIAPIVPALEQDASAPEFTIMRSDTNTQELISPPTFASDNAAAHIDDHSPSKRFSRLRTSSNASTTSKRSSIGEKRLSQRLHLPHSRSRASSQSSVNVPSDLPDIQDLSLEGEEKEARWEERATILAQANPNSRPKSQDGRAESKSPDEQLKERLQGHSPAHLSERPVMGSRSLSSATADDDIQKAIQLHEAGDLAQSTAMFGRLANGNAMAEIMYGLALRHGWGITPDPALAVQYLSAAAASAALVESAALSSGMKKGGAAKGELVLAIYELANSFRHGWGVEKDPIAARKYYETAANLGDTDAMNEVARCYEMGDGGKKDRVSSEISIPSTIKASRKPNRRCYPRQSESESLSFNIQLKKSSFTGHKKSVYNASASEHLLSPISIPQRSASSHSNPSHQASMHLANTLVKPIVHGSAILPPRRTKWE